MLKRTIILINISVLFLSCSDNITNSEPEPGRRDYIWTVDTINTFNGIYRIWGSSPQDVWCISPGGITQDIFHYDGKQWSTDNEFRLLSPHSIWGFSKNDVYLGGSAGDIWHFDGNTWSKTAKLSKDGRTVIVFDNMWGKSSKNIYTSGAYTDDRGYANNSVIDIIMARGQC